MIMNLTIENKVALVTGVGYGNGAGNSSSFR